MQPDEEILLTLPTEMVRVIREKVSTGAYSSNSEVIREALRGWMERERRLELLDAAIVQGITDAEGGRAQDVDEFRAELHRHVTCDVGHPQDR